MLSFSTKPTTDKFLISLVLIFGIAGGAYVQEVYAQEVYVQESADPAAEIFKQVFGDSASEVSGVSKEALKIPVGLVVDDRFSGDIQAKISNGTTVLLDRQALLEILDPRLMLEKAGALREALTDTFVSFEQLRSFGIDAGYDSLLLRVSLNIPASMKKPGTLRLKELPETYTTDMITADPFSAYLNYYTQAGFLYNQSDDRDEMSASFRGRLDPLFQLYRWVLEGGGSYDTEGSPQFDFDYLRLIHDFPGAGLRLAAGTINATAGGSITTLPLEGIGIGTESALSSISDQYTPLTQEILLEQPAEVSIYLNGRLLKSSRLDAGTHTLVDFPYTGGLNDVRIVITGEDGSERVLSSFVPFDAGLLKPREISFAVSAGAPRSDLNDPLASGFFSYGIHKNVTLGLAFQGDRELAVGNLYTIFATPMGNIGGNFGVSLPFSGVEEVESGKQGYGGQFNYRLTFPSRRVLPSLGFQFEYIGDSFLKNVNSSSVDSYKYRMRSVIGQTLPLKGFVSLSSVYSIGRNDIEDNLQTSVTFLKGLKKIGSLSIGFTFTELTSGNPEWQGSLSFSINPGSETSRSAMYSQNLRTGQGGANLTWRDEKRESLYTASLSAYPPAENEQIAMDGGAYFNTPWFRTNFSNSIYGIPGSSGLGERFSGSLGGAVLFTGGRFALAGPLQDSFILVVPGPDVENELLAVRNTRGGGSLKEGTGRTLVFSNVKSYSPFNLRMELPYTAPDVVLQQDMVMLIPSYRSGNTIMVGLKKSIFAEGYLLTLDGEPIKLQAGRVVPTGSPGPTGSEGPAGRAVPTGSEGPTDGEGEEIVFFTDEYGYFQLHDLEPGEYRLTLFAGGVAGGSNGNSDGDSFGTSNGNFAGAEFTVPSEVENPYQLGEIVLPVVQE